VKDLGADTTINYATTDFVEAARRETGGRGVDVVLESVGGDMFDRSFQALAHGGRLVVIGSASGQLGTVQVPFLLLNNLAIAGFSIHGTAARAPEALRAASWESRRIYRTGMGAVARSACSDSRTGGDWSTSRETWAWSGLTTNYCNG